MRKAKARRLKGAHAKNPRFFEKEVSYLM